MATRKILAYSGSVESATRIKDELSKLTGNRILITSNHTRIVMDNLILRYGNSREVDVSETNVNSIEFITACADKLEFSRLMNENNIVSPHFIKMNESPREYPVIIRTKMNASGARGIYVIENEEEFQNMFSYNYWWTKFYPTKFEIRAHIFLHGDGNVSVPRIFRKVGRDSKRPIRNNEDYSYKLRRVNRYKKAMPVIKKIAGLMREKEGKFFALDMGWSSELKKYVIFEANSAPGINDNTAKLYAKFLFDEGVLNK